MKFIQEVLNLIQDKQIKKNLDGARDWFQFGRSRSSSVGNPVYSPKMKSQAIRYDDLKADITAGLATTTSVAAIDIVHARGTVSNFGSLSDTTGCTATSAGSNGEVLITFSTALPNTNYVVVATNSISGNSQPTDTIIVNVSNKRPGDFVLKNYDVAVSAGDADVVYDFVVYKKI